MLKSRDFGNIVVASLSLLFLKLDRNTTDLAMSQPLHKMCDKASDLVAKGLAGNDSNLLAYPLVGVKVKGQPCVILFNDDPRGLFDGLGPDATLQNKITHHYSSLQIG